MNYIRKIAERFKGFFGTTVEITGKPLKNPNRISKVNAEARTDAKKKEKNERFYTKLDICLTKIIKCVARIFVGAIIYYLIASLAPGLREEIPSFYRLVDFILASMEWLFQVFWQFVEWSYQIFWQFIDQISHLFG